MAREAARSRRDGEGGGVLMSPCESYRGAASPVTGLLMEADESFRREWTRMRTRSQPLCPLRVKAVGGPSRRSIDGSRPS